MVVSESLSEPNKDKDIKRVNRTLCYILLIPMLIGRGIFEFKDSQIYTMNSKCPQYDAVSITKM